MKAILQRDFLAKASLVALLGVVGLSLGACGTRGSWPNLTTVPPREEAFRPTATQPGETAQAAPLIDPVKARGEIRAGLSSIKDDLKVLEQQSGADRSTIQTDIGDYEKAVGRFAAAPGAVTGGSDVMATAQLYLSRVTRTRDSLRRIAERSESHERDLTGIRARISALPDEGLVAEADALSQKLAALHADAAAEVAKLNPYAGGELARLRLLSFDDAANAVDASPAEGEGAPALVWRAGQPDAAYSAALSGLLAGLGDKSVTQILVQVAGSDNALGQRNSLLIKAMSDLVKAGVPLGHIRLAVKRDPAVEPAELRLYIIKPQA